MVTAGVLWFVDLKEKRIDMTIYEQMLGYIRREPFVVCRIKRSC